MSSELLFETEGELQKWVESNMEHVLGLQFVCSEMALNGFRIDTLAYDSVNKRLVIIEYKIYACSGLLEQGLAYLTNAKRNIKSLLYECVKNLNISTDELDLITIDAIDIILISQRLTNHQLQIVSLLNNVKWAQVKRYVTSNTGEPTIICEFIRDKLPSAII